MKPIVIPQIKDVLSYYPKNKVLDIRRRFNEVIVKYQDEIVKSGTMRQLTDFGDELLKLTMSNVLYIGSAYSSRTPVNETYKSYLELEPLFKSLVHYAKVPTQIQFKFGDKKLTVKDRKLSEWVKNRLLTELEAMSLPAEFKDLRFMALAKGDTEVTAMLQERAVRKPLTKGAADYIIVQSIRTYLDQKVTLGTTISSDITPAEARFYIELFVAIEYFETDYLDTITNMSKGTKSKNFQMLLNRWHHKSLIASVTYP